MSDTKFEVEIRPATKAGKIKAFADVRLLLPDGEVFLHGFAVIQQDGKPAWVGFPQNPGRNKFFPVVEAKGRIEKAIIKAILDAFQEEAKGKKRAMDPLEDE